jgi:hypothetical protein
VVQSRRGRALVARNVKPEAVTVMAHAR